MQAWRLAWRVLTVGRVKGQFWQCALLQVSICIPAWDLTEADGTASGSVKATLKNGTTVEGAPFGVLVSYDGKEKNSLAALKKLRVVHLPAGYEQYHTNSYDQLDMERGSVISWRLMAAEKAFEIRNPQFWFRYYSTDGYIMGGSDRTTRTASVSLKKGEDELEAPISDFSEVTVRRNTPRGPAQVAVTAPVGTVTEGGLSLNHKDSKGIHGSNEWWLGGVLQGTSLTRVVMSEGTITLRRK